MPEIRARIIRHLAAYMGKMPDKACGFSSMTVSGRA
jgi:hypothetical protein